MSEQEKNAIGHVCPGTRCFPPSGHFVFYLTMFYITIEICHETVQYKGASSNKFKILSGGHFQNFCHKTLVLDKFIEILNNTLMSILSK